MEVTLKEILDNLKEDVLVFNLGKGWQVHVWKDGKVYIQGLKYEDEKHWTTFKEIKINLHTPKGAFLNRITQILETQTFVWKSLE